MCVSRADDPLVFLQTTGRKQLKLTLQLEISTFHLLINVSCVFNVYLNMEKLLMVIIFILLMSPLVSQNLHQSHLR